MFTIENKYFYLVCVVILLVLLATFCSYNLKKRLNFQI